MEPAASAAQTPPPGPPSEGAVPLLLPIAPAASGPRGSLIFGGPASGKTTLHLKHPTLVYDPEMVIDFRTQPILGPSYMWEHTIDLLSLYFNVSVPVIMLALKCDRLAVSSCVAPQNAALVRWLAEGLSQAWPVSVVRLDDAELEARVAHRKQDPNQRICYNHGGFTYTVSTHMMLHTFSLYCPAIRLISIDEFTQAPLRVVSTPLADLHTSRLQMFVWEQKAYYTNGPAKHVVIEVLPHLYVLCVEDRPRLLYAVDLFESTKEKLVLECVPKTLICARVHRAATQECTSRVHVTASQVSLIHTPSGAPDTMPLLRPLHIDFIPTHKLRLPPAGYAGKCCVLAYYGTFAPIHRGHLETLQLAKEHAERAMSYHVVGAYVCPMPVVSNKKADMLPALMPWRQRAAIADFVLEGVDFATVDSYVYETTASYDTHPMHTFPARLARTHPSLRDVEVLWVNGTDMVTYSVTADKLRERKCRLLMVPRHGHEHSRMQVDQEYIVETARPQTLTYSSTEVRRLVCAGNFSRAGDIIGNRAALAYLLHLKHESERAHGARQAEKEAPPPPPPEEACVLS